MQTTILLLWDCYYPQASRTHSLSALYTQTHLWLHMHTSLQQTGERHQKLLTHMIRKKLSSNCNIYTTNQKFTYAQHWHDFCSVFSSVYLTYIALIHNKCSKIVTKKKLNQFSAVTERFKVNYMFSDLIEVIKQCSWFSLQRALVFSEVRDQNHLLIAETHKHLRFLLKIFALWKKSQNRKIFCK